MSTLVYVVRSGVRPVTLMLSVRTGTTVLECELVIFVVRGLCLCLRLCVNVRHYCAFSLFHDFSLQCPFQSTCPSTVMTSERPLPL